MNDAIETARQNDETAASLNRAKKIQKLVEALAWEACNIAQEGRLIHGQLEKIRAMREELKKA